MRKLRYLLKRAVFKLSPRAAERLNIDFRLQAENRRFLEQAVFGYINTMAVDAGGPLKTLFVGLDKHNWHYRRLRDTSSTRSTSRRARRCTAGRAGIGRAAPRAWRGITAATCSTWWWPTGCWVSA